jgi:hypothetical protein
MRNSLLALALFTPTCFVGMQIADSTQTAPVSGSRPLPHAVKNEVPESCPVTKPPTPAFVPPLPYPNETTPGSFWFGTNNLWILLRTDGAWPGLPQWPDGTFRQKLFWWHEGYDLRETLHPPLKVAGKRLGSPTPPLQSDVSHGWTNDESHPFITDGINLPALGCWKITGRYADAELSFVVWVMK